MISEKTYEKYKKLINYEPTGILHILSGTMIYTHLDNTGVGRKARRMMILHQWLSMVGAFSNNKPSTKRIPLVFRTPNSAKSYMGMVLSKQDKLEPMSGYIFRVDDTTLASPTEEAIMGIKGQLLHKNNPHIKRHINEFEFIPMDYDSTMRLYTDHKLTKEEMLNEIRVYE
ncbi:MAG: hypothetical protein JHC33_02280, partial [Ignisphaera sp.]|nr:hypothetical protein [Ignisphaera sp.]